MPTNVPPKVYLRLTVRDAAGNAAVAETKDPVLVDLSVPEPHLIGLIRGVEHLGIVIGLNFIPPLWPAALVGAFMLPRRRPPQISLPPPRYDQGHGYAPHGPNQPW